MTVKKNKLFWRFVADKKSYIIAYWLNSLLLIAFFGLYFGRADILYPGALSLSVFLVAIYLSWHGYKGFNSELPQAAQNVGYSLPVKTNEQQGVQDAIAQLHLFYANEMGELTLDNREMRRILSQFVHSLKTPLTIINLATQDLIKSSAAKAAELVGIEDIADENMRITGILDNLLSLFRLEEFSADYSPQPHDLNRLLADIINEHRRDFIYSRVVPRLALPTAIPPVLTDEKWNKLLLEQIISNAIKYSHHPEQIKDVYFSARLERGTLTLSIRDEGMGIPAYDLPKVRDPFFTGENGRKVKNSTGIGLYIAAKIAAKLGHGLVFNTAPGAGTTVEITYLAIM